MVRDKGPPSGLHAPPSQYFGLQSGENGWSLKGKERELATYGFGRTSGHLLEFKFIDRRSV